MLIHQRSHEVGLGRVAWRDDHGACHFGERGHKLLRNGSMHNHAPRAGAALTRGGVGAAHAFQHGGANIGAFPDNRGIAAAHFKRHHSAGPIKIGLQHGAASAPRTRQHDSINIGVVA